MEGTGKERPATPRRHIRGGVPQGGQTVTRARPISYSVSEGALARARANSRIADSI